jgi:hypothetical protein
MPLQIAFAFLDYDQTGRDDMWCINTDFVIPPRSEDQWLNTDEVMEVWGRTVTGTCLVQFAVRGIRP